MPSVAPPRPKTVLTADQRAKRMISMAQSAMRQGSFDEALDFLNQAQVLVPDDATIKASIQAVMAEFMAKSSGKRPAGFPPAARSAPAAGGAPAAAASAPELPKAAPPPPVQAETAEAVEKRIRAQLEQEYQARREPARTVSPETTRAQILAKAGPEEPGGRAFPLPVSIPAAPSEDPLTETMAEVYLSQGHLEEALSVYESVLRREPGRADLKQKVAEMRARLALPEMPSAAPEPPARPPAPVSAPAEPPRMEPAAVAVSPEPVRSRPRVSYV
jgi:tetratricopeptide (TPR) repeat protein